MQQCLALPTPAIQVARFAMFFQLRHMASNRAPTANLS
jgi:hypothetical protein